VVGVHGIDVRHGGVFVVSDSVGAIAFDWPSAW